MKQIKSVKKEKEKQIKEIEQLFTKNGWYKDKNGKLVKELSKKVSDQLDYAISKYIELLNKGVGKTKAWEKSKSHANKKTKKNKNGKEYSKKRQTK